jgi:transcriptional regulator with PAS, ATPase and Fis domain
MVLARSGHITISDLPSSVVAGANSASVPTLPEGELSLKRHAANAQDEVIREALRRADGNRRRAAALLGISVRSLFYKLKALGISES